VSEIAFSNILAVALTALGVGFLIANLWIVIQLLQFYRYRASALLTWPARKPPYYRIFLGFGVVFGVLLVVKFVVRGQPLVSGFGELMMLFYYTYLWPMCFRIKRGLYENGIWTDSRFVPYEQIGGLSWKEEHELTLVIIYRLRSLARHLNVPRQHYGGVRRLLRDKIDSHDLHFTMKTFDLGGDEREVI
jgi:hypothetical protein